FVGLDFTYDFSWWHAFLPPMWFGAPFEMFLHANYLAGLIVLSVLALVMPVLAIALYIRLMPSFEQNLQKLMEESHTGKVKRKLLDNMWANVACFRREEHVFFRFASIMLSQEREFKLKVYPMIGMALVFPFIFMFNGLAVGDSFQDVR